jgi:16S rRNA (guanine527-N7)-methyltransferase
VNDREAEALELGVGARELGVELDDQQVETLLAYLDLLYFWNASAGLTSVDRDAAVRLHVCDSLAVLPDLVGVGELVDLGSGGGLPGIPIAIARPHVRVVLVESKRRKASFLNEAVRTLRLGNCVVLEEDARVLGASGRRFDALTARAFMPPAQVVELAAPMVAEGGILALLCGPQVDADELSGEKHSGLLRLRSARAYRLPGSSESRRIIVLEREGAC